MKTSHVRLPTLKRLLQIFGPPIALCFLLGILRANWTVSTGRAVVQSWSFFWEKPVVNPPTTTMAVEHLSSVNDSILILFWTEYFSQPFTSTSEHRMVAQQALDNCPVKNCLLTNRRDLVNRSAAVIFHIRELADQPDKSVPSFRSPNQYYVFYLLESPPHTNMMLDEYDGFFNLTFTYRLDSDIPSDHYYRDFKPKLWNDPSNFEDAWRKKAGFAVIFVSNCCTPSFRHVYIEELARYIPLDVFGSCGNNSCNKTSEHCDEKVSTYKFYLAFENSVCKDYVTEKMFRAYNQEAVPVVYGGADYSQIFPPNSYINILDFSSPRLLADHLRKVAGNKHWYSQYFQWKFKSRYLTLPKDLQSPEIGWCKLCGILNDGELSPKAYNNLGKWWFDEARCTIPIIGDRNGNQVWTANPYVNHIYRTMT
ncbi:hypothetical protein RvY_07757 [Ramazzottius varieornatus]|uniref:Fucosyltransferase n=1 Tax=Ramazzottius varieornatus TaxID=947166 RepID=A0A1D1VBN9_RAMVA|nr:hypothetical protein RvY_07757 [Ramazzottius varieornatus]